MKFQIGGSINYMYMPASESLICKVWWQKNPFFLDAAFKWFAVDSLTLIHNLTFLISTEIERSQDILSRQHLGLRPTV